LAEELTRSTRFHAVPAVLRQMVDRLPAVAPGLLEIYVGGDAVPPGLLADLRALLPEVRVRVLYGPTEGTIFCTCHTGPEPLLGRPLDRVRVRLRDHWGREVPAGVPGEVCLGGPGVARGY